MDTFLPKGFEARLTRRQMSGPVRPTKLGVTVEGERYPVLRQWATGFAVRAGAAPALSGIVDLYDGAEHLHQCLITAKQEVDGETVFTVKRGSAFDYAAASEMDCDATVASAR